VLNEARAVVAPWPVRLWRFGGLAVLFLLFSAVYEFVRYLVGVDSPLVPREHAQRVVEAERSLGLFIEPHLQRLAADIPGVTQLTVWIYTYEHLAGSIVFMIWLWWMRPAHFPFVWRWFWAAHAIALVGFWLYPLAPPRLVPGLGLADPTAAELAAAPGASAFSHIRNDFAAMPSLHVGYPLLFAIVLYFLLPQTRVRWLVWLWPAAVLFTVLATGNHYWLDGVGGAAVVAMAAVVAIIAFPDLRRPWGANARENAPG